MSPPPFSRRGTCTVRNYANSGGVGTTDTARRLPRVRFYHSSTTPIIPNLRQLTTEYILCLQNIKGVKNCLSTPSELFLNLPIARLSKAKITERRRHLLSDGKIQDAKQRWEVSRFRLGEECFSSAYTVNLSNNYVMVSKERLRSVIVPPSSRCI